MNNFHSSNKYTTLMQDIKNRGNYGGGRTTVGIQEPSVLPAPFLCKPKIALENKAYSCVWVFLCFFFLLPCTVYGILVWFQPGIKPVPPAMEVQSLSSGPPEKSLENKVYKLK